MTKYLGIDYGLSHIGLAVSEHTLATPLHSISNDVSLYDRLDTIIKEQGITHIVCGLPEGQLAPIISKFADHLRDQTGITVILHEETLSTKEAQFKLVQAGASKSKRRDDHAYAACLILEDYLEFGNS